jgi:N6-adenosine-specific RNA methylase IME4
MKKYKTIVIDPPWEIDWMRHGKEAGNRFRKYPTMSVEQIKKIPVGELASEGCNLFMWTTHTYLPDALDIVKTWGFKYHCLITWDKGSGMVVHGFERRTEFVVYAYKCPMTVKHNGRSFDTLVREIPDLFEERKNVHSRKPISFIRAVEAKTEAPRLEMFARYKRAGWDVWGNEVVSDIDIEALGAINPLFAEKP